MTDAHKHCLKIDSHFHLLGLPS